VVLGSAWVCAAALLLALGLPPRLLAAQTQVQGQQPSAGVIAPAKETTEGNRCGSVVIRHCHRRRETSSMVLDPALSGRNGAPMQWEVVQFGGPDNDEIVVYGERIREPAIKEVFERTFGSPLGYAAMTTRNARGGARCTTIVRSGAIQCSNGGGGLPALENPLTDWTF
jgi:hypothetical protein